MTTYKNKQKIKKLLKDIKPTTEDIIDFKIHDLNTQKHNFNFDLKNNISIRGYKIA
jgi:hypothetical protein